MIVLTGDRHERRDNVYYEFLGVDSDATPEEIKNAYHFKARLLIPDQKYESESVRSLRLSSQGSIIYLDEELEADEIFPSSPLSEGSSEESEDDEALQSSPLYPDEHFEELEGDESFRVLEEACANSDDHEDQEARDRHGREGVSQDSMMDMDPSAVFGMLFGSKRFEDYIGKLGLSLLASVELEDDTRDPQVRSRIVIDKLRALQMHRVEKLIRVLKCRLQLYVDGSKEEFVRWGNAEAKYLSEAAYGEDMLHTIGYIYRRRAAAEIGKVKRYMKLPFVAERVRLEGHILKMTAKLAFGFSDIIEMEDVLRDLNEGENEKDNFIKPMNDKRESMLRSIWQIHAADIELTLLHICDTVLRDRKESKMVLKLRAKALKKLGKIFLSAKTEGTEKSLPQSTKYMHLNRRV